MAFGMGNPHMTRDVDVAYQFVADEIVTSFLKRLSENYIFHLIRLSSKWIMAI